MKLRNRRAREGCDRCPCGCKYWEDDCCIDCGTSIDGLLRDPGWVAANRGPQPKYPHVTVELSGNDGNAMTIIGTTRRALRHAGASQDELTEFFNDAISGDYDHVLQTVMRWVEVE